MPEQTVPLNLMIKRLEEANARAHDKIARPDEQVCVLEEEVVRHFSDQQMHPAVALRRSSRGGLALGLIASLMATSLGVLALVWQSPYSDTAKRIVAQWASSLGHSIPQEFAAPADLASSGLEQRLQTMARDLASVAQGVKQLKNSLEQISRDNAAVAEQFEAALSQFTHDTAAAAEQFRATLSQITRDTAVIAEQFKASQEQTVRPRVRRKPVAIVPQVEAQPEALIRR
jgi:hypothetical protein